MGEAAALVSAFTWSCTSIILTSLSARTSPVVLSALRLATGSFALALILLVSGQIDAVRAVSLVALVAMLGSGLLGYGVGDTLYIRALKKVGIQRTFPITQALFVTLTVLGGIVLLGEPFSIGLPVGGALIGFGIFLIVVRGRQGPPMADSEPLLTGRDLYIKGYGLMAVVAVAWAAATMWLAAGRGDLPAIAASSLRTPAGAVGLLAFAGLTQPAELKVPFTTRRHIGTIVITGLLGTAFGSLLYVYAVGEAGAARSAILNSTAPVMALPLSVLFLKEKMTRQIVVGTLVCVVGVALVVS